MEELLSYAVMAFLIIVIALLVLALIKALVRTLVVTAVCTVLWFAAVELFPEQTSAIRSEAAALMAPLLDDFSLGQLLKGSGGPAPAGPADGQTEPSVGPRD
jgi:hypothetical protein